jgi:hypothetical protein
MIARMRDASGASWFRGHRSKCLARNPRSTHVIASSPSFSASFASQILQDSCCVVSCWLCCFLPCSWPLPSPSTAHEGEDPGRATRKRHASPADTVRGSGGPLVGDGMRALSRSASASARVTQRSQVFSGRSDACAPGEGSGRGGGGATDHQQRRSTAGSGSFLSLIYLILHFYKSTVRRARVSPGGSVCRTRPSGFTTTHTQEDVKGSVWAGGG